VKVSAGRTSTLSVIVLTKASCRVKLRHALWLACRGVRRSSDCLGELHDRLPSLLHGTPLKSLLFNSPRALSATTRVEGATICVFNIQSLQHTNVQQVFRFLCFHRVTHSFFPVSLRKYFASKPHRTLCKTTLGGGVRKLFPDSLFPVPYSLCPHSVFLFDHPRAIVLAPRGNLNVSE
jgi:hypothetical protein